MKNIQPGRAEFYGAAASTGFYGEEESGLYGRKDYVRKFWEDIVFKLVCRPYIENLMKFNKKIRILDLGSGSGDSFELLTHIPFSIPNRNLKNDFILEPLMIEDYLGIDNNKKVLSYGKSKYSKFHGVVFKNSDLEKGLPDKVLRSHSYDIYISTYGSLSFLNPEYLGNLLYQIFQHAHNGSVLFFDVHGKYCPAWPKYWMEENIMLPYTFDYLKFNQQNSNHVEWINLAFWSVERMKELLDAAAAKAGVNLKNLSFTDRSIYTGRLMDRGILSTKPMPFRNQINRLLDNEERADVEHLKIELDHLEQYKDINPGVWDKLTDYQRQWNRIIILLEALLHRDDLRVKNFLENTDIEVMSDELKFLTWLFRNADRFPVVDFWASVIDPQIAIILRNIELSYTEAVGCGHSLICAMEIEK
jgi:SAM-dependent methyltransferase